MEFNQRGITGSGTDGGFADYVCVPAYQPHVRPPELTPDLGALVEPMAVSVHGWRLAEANQPDSVVVVGVGNIGLLAILAAGGIDTHRHITADIPLRDVVTQGFIPLSERKAEHIKIQVTPQE